MIPTGVVLLAASTAMAVAGALGYLLSRESTGRSRGVAVALFGHGALGTSGLLTIAYVVHVHALATIHFHSFEEAVGQTFLCDLEWICAAWIAGAIAGVVIVASFLLSQGLARTILARALRNGVVASDLGGDGRMLLLLVPDARPDAFSLALLGRKGRWGLCARDYVIVTTGMMAILSEEERAAVLEHEWAHVRSRDDRYLPYFHVLASIVFFDPFLRRLRDRLRRRYEFDADDSAARRTRQPRALARALLKVYESTAKPGPGVAFLGQRRRPEILERIERLLALADRMDAGKA